MDRYAFFVFFVAAWSGHLAADIEDGAFYIENLPLKEGPKLEKVLDEGVFGTAQTMLFVVAIVALLWVSYASVSKFRECQVGKADWSELLVLGVAAAALLVFIGMTIGTATEFLVGT